MRPDWMDRAPGFATHDARQAEPGAFFPLITAAAEVVEPGGGLHIVQSFDPVPLYAVLKAKGFDHHTDEVAPDEFHAYFHLPATTTGPRSQAEDGEVAEPERGPSPTAVVSTAPSIGAIALGGGALTASQIDLVLAHLPIDVTFIDEHDRVRYASAQPHEVDPGVLAALRAGAIESATRRHDDGADHLLALRDGAGRAKGVLVTGQRRPADEALADRLDPGS